MGRTAASIMQLGLMIVGVIVGWFGFSYANQVSTHTGGGFLWILGIILVTAAAIIVGLFLNIILHEAGHLIAGLLTGYGFVFYNVLNLTITKKNGKLSGKIYRVAGTGGGCMLLPPELKNGTFSYKLYISGGFLANFLMSAMGFSLFYSLAATADLWARAFLVFGILAAFLGLTNFIPLNVVAPNDGYLFFNLGRAKNAAMRHGYWSSGRIQAFIAEGTRPRDIPVNLFNWVDTEDISDLFVMETACNRYKYLLDRQELSEARALIQALYDNPHSFDMQKMSCHCELLFHELIGECRQAEIDRLYTEELKNYIKAAHSEISVQRLLYAYARLAIKDDTIAEEHLDLFHKACVMPLQSGLVPGEQELIALIDTLADKRQSD